MKRLLLFVLCWLLVAPAGAEAKPQTTVRVSLAPVFRAPSESSEQVTQVLLGDPVVVQRVKGGWAEILVPDQYRTSKGYPGWIRVNQLTRDELGDGSEFLTVLYPEVHLRTEPNPKADSLARAYMSARLIKAGAQKSGWWPVKLQGDSDILWVRATQVSPEKPLALSQGDEVISKAKLFRGTPYLWGGMSHHGIDCSGLVYTVYRLHGLTVPRDADQQFQVGKEVGQDFLKPGDMVFFGKRPDDITHVGLYAGNGDFIHASSGRGVVVSRLFQGWYLEHYQGARRILKSRPSGLEILTPNL